MSEPKANPPSLMLSGPLERTLSAVGMETVDAAKVAVVKGLAAAVEADPLNASLWREYRAALADLLPASGKDDTLDLLARLRDTTDPVQEDT